MNNVRKIFSAKSIIMVAVIALLFAITPQIVFADSYGWISSGGVGGSGGGGGGDGWGCSGSDYTYREDCAGVSWIFYKYVGGESSKGKSFSFNDVAGGGSVTIPGTCATTEGDEAGFWHLGINAQGLSASWMDKSYFLEPGAKGSNGGPDHGLKGYTDWYHSYETSANKWGHWQTISWGQVPEWAPYRIPSGGVTGDWRYKWYSNSWHNMYKATKFGTKADVYEDFKVAYSYVNGTTYDTKTYNQSGSKGFPDIFAFCYGDYMTKKTATYGGTSTVEGSNGDLSSNGGAYSITFRHKLKKNSAEPSDYNPGSNWSTTVTGGGATGSGTWSLTNSSYTEVKNNTITGTLEPGESKTFKQYMTYDSSVVFEGGQTKRTQSNTTEVSRTISRKRATFTGSVTGKVGDTVNDGSTPVEVSTSTATISFQHAIKRENRSSTVKDEAGGTARTKYHTAVSGKDARGVDTSPRGTARTETYTNYLNKGSSQTVIAYTDETFTVNLLPGETKTFCQTLYYDAIVDATNGNTEDDTTACVKVRRKDAKCPGNIEYGVESGKNYGSISVTKNNGTSWAISSPTEPSDFTLNSHNATVEAWTKPNDRVIFKEEMCEGAELSNQYFGRNIGITYTIDATSGYMSDLGTSSWNNSSLQGYANAGKGIFAGNSYSATTQSPASSNYTITNSHLGTSFYQRLTWTDLWMSGGNADGTHNASWSNTATATVYTPYNYTTSLYTDVNRVYGLAGTVAGDISLTYSINKRANPKVNGSSEYATRSKKTKYQLISFKVSKNIASSSVTLASEYYADDNGTTSFGSLCNSIISSAARAYDCRQVAAVSGGGNSDRTAGESSTSKGGYSVSISDTEEIGTKICVVGAIWPADSHNLPTTTLTNGSDQSAALTETGNQWHLSQPSCFNVAKKPNFQVRATGAYAEQKVNTYISKRDDKLYGSWADFDLSSGGLINGMASGASAWGATAEPSVRACYYSLMSFANSKCTESKEVGNLPVNTNLASDPGNIYNQILTRYTSTSTSATSGGTNESNAYELKLEGACEYDETTGRYVPRGVSGTPSFSCLSNGAYYTKISGTAKTENGTRTVSDIWGRRYTTYVELWTSTDGYHSSNTYIIQVNGTLYINQNFRYGNTSELENTTYGDITEIPQVIFIADDIKVSPDVTHLDAWLVAKNNIDTCYPGGGAKVSISNCDSQLTVTGPVIAKTLSLNRTYGGAGGVMNNSQPAEIFQLSPATYLWGYAQTQRYSQAITTFQRELPTRY